MKKKTIEEYEEWKMNIANIFSKKDHVVDAVWNAMYEYAEREGYAELMEEDEGDMVDLIGIIVSNLKD